MAESQPTQAMQQPPLMSHPLDLDQQGDSKGKDAYLFSNPTFESYLDPVSDEELQLMESCITPRSAIKQQASQTAIHVAPSLGTVDSTYVSCHGTKGKQQTSQLPHPFCSSFCGPAMPHWDRHKRCRHTQ